MSRSLSIVIPSHSRVEYLRRCLTSVQAYAPPRTEILVVDDGSAEGIISRVAESFLNVTLLRHERSQGFCAAVNRGILASSGEIVELLNDDAEVTADWVEPVLPWFENPKIAAVTPLVLQDREDRSEWMIDTAGDEYDFGGFARKRGHGQKFTPHGPFAQPREVWGISAAAGFYRRSALLEVGGFPESFRAYFDDVDLSFRLRRAGYLCGYEPTSRVWHAVSASYGRSSPKTLRMQSRNEELVFWRNVRGWQRLRWLPRHVAVLAGKAVRRWREGSLQPWLAGRLEALRSHANCASRAEIRSNE
jgi:GT2 family glycosyltransferase